MLKSTARTFWEDRLNILHCKNILGGQAACWVDHIDEDCWECLWAVMFGGGSGSVVYMISL